MWAWILPNLTYKNQIDYALSPTRYRTIKNFVSIKNIRLYLQSKPIKCELYLDKWLHAVCSNEKSKNEE